MCFFLFSHATKQHLPEKMCWKIELKCQPAGMIPSFFCHKAQSTFILCIHFAEDGLSLRVISKTAYIHPFCFFILKHIPVAVYYVSQNIALFFDCLSTHVPDT